MARRDQVTIKVEPGTTYTSTKDIMITAMGKASGGDFLRITPQGAGTSEQLFPTAGNDTSFNRRKTKIPLKTGAVIRHSGATNLPVNQQTIILKGYEL